MFKRLTAVTVLLTILFTCGGSAGATNTTQKPPQSNVITVISLQPAESVYFLQDSVTTQHTASVQALQPATDGDSLQ